MGLFSSKPTEFTCPVCASDSSFARRLKSYMLVEPSNLRYEIADFERAVSWDDFFCLAALYASHMRDDELEGLIPATKSAWRARAVQHAPLVRNSPKCYSCSEYFHTSDWSMKGTLQGGNWFRNGNKIWENCLGAVRWAFDNGGVKAQMVPYCPSCASRHQCSDWNYGRKVFGNS